MLRYSLVLLGSCLAAGPAAAATWADALFEELSKDFGSVPRGPTLTHPFRVRNNTDRPVNIAGVRVSCGCVTATVRQSYLKPGEETHILAQMDTTRFTGIKSVTIFVTFNAPSHEEVRLWVQANARNDFTVTPDTLAFGQLRRGNYPPASALLTFYGGSDTQVTEVKCESNYVQYKIKEVRRQETEVAYQLTARLREDAPVGKWYTDLWLKTNLPNTPPIRVPLTVEIESSLSVSPDPVAMGPVKVQAESERRVIVRGVKPFKITGVVPLGDRDVPAEDNQLAPGDADLVARDTTTESKAIHVLTLKLKGSRPGGVNRTLRVLTDLPEDNKIDFQISAVVTPP
jgi:hypothetical protein